MASDGGGSVKQSSSPWPGLTPWLLGWEPGINKYTSFDQWATPGEGLYDLTSTEIMNRPRKFFPGSTVADFSPQTNTALGAIEQRAIDGSPLTDAAQGEMLTTLQGDYLDAGNPYLAGLGQAIGDQVQEQTGARFAGSGRKMGSPAEIESFQRTMANTMAPIAFQNFESERDRMNRGAAIAPTIADADYADLNRLRQVGAEHEAFDQAQINEAVQRFNFGQNEPYDRLTTAAQILMSGGGLGGTSTQQTSAPPLGPLDYLGAGTSMAGTALPFFFL